MKKIIYFITVFFASLIGFAQDGSLDLSFVVQDGVAEYSQAIVQADGKILIVENFVDSNGNTSPSKVKRFNNNGNVDGSFNDLIVTEGGFMASLAIQPDGKIIVVGPFTELNNVTVNNLVRLNPDGSLDMSFNNNPEIDGSLLSVAIQADGKILVGGVFQNYNGVSRDGLARLNLDGSLDLTFNTSIGFTDNNYITKIITQNDGKILVSGLLSFSGVFKLINRLNSDGSEDESFINITPFIYMYCDYGCGYYSVFLEKDNKILIGGVFDVYNDINHTQLLGSNMVRLNANGTLDTCFYTDLNISDTNSFYPSAIQSDGKIIVTGYYPDYNGQVINNIARLQPNGQIDTDFDIGSGSNGGISSAVVQPDGKIIITGIFTEYDGVPRNHIARINSTSSLSSEEFGGKTVKFYPNPVKDILHLDLPQGVTAKQYEIYDLLSKGATTATVLNYNSINVSHLSNGVYMLKVETSDGYFINKFLKE
ncbi:T9SS type A sorting domain-containing protein [Flavobacterium enshiense]|uniref:T9SS type A sorting domain-containing protein n=1 Tax=Flavobacterium enshiense TaxID=1341165 RepID=UPI00345D7A7E